MITSYVPQADQQENFTFPTASRSLLSGKKWRVGKATRNGEESAVDQVAVIVVDTQWDSVFDPPIFFNSTDPISRSQPALRDRVKFNALVNEWRQQRRAISSHSKIVACRAHQSIIGMGEAALPLIMEQLRQGNLGHWFYALEVITQHQPVQPEDAGNYKKMAVAWLEWWDKTGHNLHGTQAGSQG